VPFLLKKPHQVNGRAETGAQEIDLTEEARELVEAY
jgi:hypothetical protein